jgi:hypothetical protein
MRYLEDMNSSLEPKAGCWMLQKAAADTFFVQPALMAAGTPEQMRMFYWAVCKAIFPTQAMAFADEPLKH